MLQWDSSSQFWLRHKDIGGYIQEWIMRVTPYLRTREMTLKPMLRNQESGDRIGFCGESFWRELWVLWISPLLLDMGVIGVLLREVQLRELDVCVPNNREQSRPTSDSYLSKLKQPLKEKDHICKFLYMPLLGGQKYMNCSHVENSVGILAWSHLNMGTGKRRWCIRVRGP